MTNKGEIMIVKYVYDYAGGEKRPVATVVAIDRDKVAVATCNLKADTFKKARGREIAAERARKGKTGFAEKPLMGFIVSSNGRLIHRQAALDYVYVKVQDLANKYYKEEGLRPGDEVSFAYPQHGFGDLVYRHGVVDRTDERHVMMTMEDGSPRTFFRSSMSDIKVLGRVAK